MNNPTVEILEDRLTLWDSAEEALVFSSGMAAISTSVLSFARPGDSILYSTPAYGGTEFLFEKLLPQFGIHSLSFSARAPAAEVEQAWAKAKAEAAGRGGRVAIIYAETPANPTNDLVDIGHLAQLAASHSAAESKPHLIVDNTMLGPLWQQPLSLGADLVLYSLTKYVGGHSDLIAGSCAGRASDVALIRTMRTILGTTTDPHTAWLLQRSLETLSIRMKKSAENAGVVAAWLREHPKIRQMGYLPFLKPGTRGADLFARQCSGAGSTFSIFLEDEQAAFRFLNTLQIVKLAVSLGGTESLASYPAGMTHVDMSEDARAAAGIAPGLVRLSIGIEEPQDLIADLAQALAAA